MELSNDMGIVGEIQRGLADAFDSSQGTAPKSEPSRARIAIAKSILAASAADTFALKLAAWFQNDLQECSRSGAFPDGSRGLWEMATFIHTNVVGDVQRIESDNSRLRVITTRSPAIKRDLQSSRHVIFW